MKIFKKVVLVILLIMSTMFLSGCVRNVSLEYSVAIIPKEGETLKDVTVYLPFPVRSGRPCKRIFTSIEELYHSQIEDDVPNATFELINTEHDKMLKINIPSLTRGFGVTGEANIINSAFDRLYPQDKYILSTIKQEKSNDEKKSYVYIYSDFEGGSGFILKSLYDVHYTDWALTHVHGGWITLIGIDKVPEDYSWQLYSIEINQKGWLKLPTTWRGKD